MRRNLQNNVLSTFYPLQSQFTRKQSILFTINYKVTLIFSMGPYEQICKYTGTYPKATHESCVYELLALIRMKRYFHVIPKTVYTHKRTQVFPLNISLKNFLNSTPHMIWTHTRFITAELLNPLMFRYDSFKKSLKAVKYIKVYFPVEIRVHTVKVLLSVVVLQTKLEFCSFKLQEWFSASFWCDLFYSNELPG